MRVLLRIVAIFAAVSVVGTLWFVATVVDLVALRYLLESGLLGALTLVGWIVTLAAGPVAAVQLWRYTESGRRAGIVLFGYGFLYYIVGLLVLRHPEASAWQITTAATVFAMPLLVLLSARAREACARARKI